MAFFRCTVHSALSCAKSSHHNQTAKKRARAATGPIDALLIPSYMARERITPYNLLGAGLEGVPPALMSGRRVQNRRKVPAALGTAARIIVLDLAISVALDIFCEVPRLPKHGQHYKYCRFGSAGDIDWFLDAMAKAPNASTTTARYVERLHRY